MTRLGEVSPATFRALERAFAAGDGARSAELVLTAARSGACEVLRAFRGHPLEDDWSDLVYNALAEYFRNAGGYLYCVTNPAQLDFYKVGKTGRTPERRLAELNNEAVVGSFVLVQSWQVYDRHGLERAAHKALAHLPSHKEFFHAPWRQVVDLVQQALQRDELLLRAAGVPLPDLAR